ncbi:MAG: hypothetical protein AAGA36_06745 [Pseudomonadota bacterium]
MKTLACLLIILLLTGPAAAQRTSLPPRIVSAPWKEATISVRRFDPIRSFLIDVGKYEPVAQGIVSKTQLEYWRLPPEAAAEFLLLRAPRTDHGYIRLVRFTGVEQTPIRIGARAWDPGGYFSLMFRVKDIDRVFEKAAALGFQGESEPIRFVFDSGDGSLPSDLGNVVIKAPDGINFALYERNSPPLSDYWDFEVLSQPFNAMQMVEHADISYGFFREELGFKAFYSDDFIDPVPSYNNFGLPQNLTTEIPRRTRILWPKPGETGRLELMEFVGLEGRNFRRRAAPPNIGILSVSYPVLDADLAFDLFRDAGGLPKYALRTFELQPYGTVAMFTAEAPDGALVNVFEVLEEAP